MVDIVIPLGKGSLWQDNELRYALRSIEKHCTNYRNIVIVGRKPEWLKNVVYIPFVEGAERGKNICNKIIAACEWPELTSEFLFTNDDIFFLKDVDCSQYPFYKKGELKKSIARKGIDPDYKKQLENTVLVLGKQGLKMFNFDTHCPINYDKKLFAEAIKKHDWNVNQGYAIKSLYANTLGIRGQYVPDCKITLAWTRDEIESMIVGRDVFSIGDSALNGAMKKLLNDMYPNPSKYE